MQVSPNWPLAYEEGRWSGHPGSVANAPVLGGRYSAQWVLRDGKWQDRQLVSKDWIAMARTPGGANPEYGYANWYLNMNRKRLSAAPATAVTFDGNGQNIVFVDKDNDLLIVVRWIDSTASLNEFIGKVIGAIR